MDTYSSMSSEMRSCLSSNSILKVLLPLDMVLLFGGLVICFITYILDYHPDGFFSTIAYWAFILGLVLAFANLHNKFLFIGLWSYGAISMLLFFKLLFGSGHSFSWDAFFRILIFGGLGYLVFRRSIIERT